MERILFVFIATVLASGWATADNRVPEASAPSHFNEATVADLQTKMAAGTISSEQLTKYYLHRILALDQNGPGVNSVTRRVSDLFVCLFVCAFLIHRLYYPCNGTIGCECRHFRGGANYGG